MIIFGTHDYGTVDVHEQTSVATRFVHVWFVPLWPVQSIVKSSLRAPFFVPLVTHSIVAGYARVWGPLLIVGSMGLTAIDDVPLALAIVGVVLGAVVTVVGWVTGKLGARASVERRAYRRAIGLPIDPAILAYHDQWSVHAQLVDQVGRKHADYRGTTTVPWERLTLDPNADTETLAFLLAIARLDEMLEASGRADHMRAIQDRLVEFLSPRLTN